MAIESEDKKPEVNSFTELAVQHCNENQIGGRRRLGRIMRGAVCDGVSFVGGKLGDGPALATAATAAVLSPEGSRGFVFTGALVAMIAARTETPNPIANTVLRGVRTAGQVGVAAATMSHFNVDSESTARVVAAATVAAGTKSAVEMIPSAVKDEGKFLGRLALAADNVTDPVGGIIRKGFDNVALRIGRKILE